MAITAEAALNLIRNLNIKVRDGRLDRAEAEKLALAALQEVPTETTPEAANAADMQPAPEPEAKPTKPTPAADPKTALLSRIADFNKAIEAEWASLQKDITSVISASAGEAFPIGDMKLDADKNVSKLNIGKSEKQGAVTVKFSMDREWDVQGVDAPAPIEATASKDATCHLNLRKEIIALTDLVADATSSASVWRRFDFPTKDFDRVTKLSASAGDERVTTILSGKPSVKDGQDAWRQWSIAAQVYLLGPDYTEAKSFRDIAKTIEVSK